jgi:hypothetical protein
MMTTNNRNLVAVDGGLTKQSPNRAGAGLRIERGHAGASVVLHEGVKNNLAIRGLSRTPDSGDEFLSVVEPKRFLHKRECIDFPAKVNR